MIQRLVISFSSTSTSSSYLITTLQRTYGTWRVFVPRGATTNVWIWVGRFVAVVGYEDDGGCWRGVDSVDFVDSCICYMKGIRR